MTEDGSGDSPAVSSSSFSSSEVTESTLVISGGEGYIDFRVGKFRVFKFNFYFSSHLHIPIY